jgi:threonine dehydrogenase-like Zn-dependent dehydrogenase
LGHEFVGVVEDVAEVSEDVKQQWIGKRVCGDINVGCATCAVCQNTQNLDACCSKMSRNHCPNRTVLGILNRNGTMAEYLTLPIGNLHLVPDDVPDEVAVFAEPLAAACRISEQGLINYDKARPDKVAILGDGKLGLMIAEVLGREHSRHGLPPDGRPVLFGKHQHKLDLVKNSGVECKFVSECQDEKAFNGVASAHAAKYDVVVDATGSPAGLSLAAGLCRPMGTLVGDVVLPET